MQVRSQRFPSGRYLNCSDNYGGAGLGMAGHGMAWRVKTRASFEAKTHKEKT